MTVTLHNNRKITRVRHKDTSYYYSRPASAMSKKHKYLTIHTSQHVVILDGKQLNAIKQILDAD